MRHLLRLNSDEVRRMIAQRNLTQKEVADQLGISLSHFAVLLARRKGPSPRLRKRIQEIFTGRTYTWDRLFIYCESTTGAYGIRE